MKRTSLFFLCLFLSGSSLLAKVTTTLSLQGSPAARQLQTTQQIKKVSKKPIKKIKKSPPPTKTVVAKHKPDTRNVWQKFWNPTPLDIKKVRRQEKRTQRIARREQRAKERASHVWRQKKMASMTEEELETLMAEVEEAKRPDLIIKCLEQLILICEDKHKLEGYLLHVADLLRERSRLEKAGKAYKRFSDLYPGSKKIEYAEHQAISCHFAETLSSDRDQSITEETLKLTDKFLARDVYSAHKEEVANIRRQCYEKLFEHEVGVFLFYFKRGSLISAQKRLCEMRDRFLPKMPDIKSRLATFEQDLQKQAASRNMMIATTIDIDNVAIKEIPKQSTQTVAQASTEKTRAKNKF